jgi:hypothetical protein
MARPRGDKECLRQECCLSPLLFKLYSEYVTQEALEGLGDFKVGGQIISTVRYAEDLVLLAKEETILQSTIDKLTEDGREYGMEINVDKTKTMRISRQSTQLQIKTNKKPAENVEEFNYFGSMITNDARCTRDIKARIAVAKAAFNRKKTLFTRKLGIEQRKKLVKRYIWSTVLYGAETWTLGKPDQKYWETFETWCWRATEQISWTDSVNNEAILHRVKKERNILHTIRRRKPNWIGHILRKNCLLSHIIERKIIRTRRRGRRRTHLFDDLKEARRYWKLKEGVKDRTLLENSVWKGYEPVARQTTI